VYTVKNTLTVHSRKMCYLLDYRYDAVTLILSIETHPTASDNHKHNARRLTTVSARGVM